MSDVNLLKSKNVLTYSTNPSQENISIVSSNHNQSDDKNINEDVVNSKPYIVEPKIIKHDLMKNMEYDEDILSPEHSCQSLKCRALINKTVNNDFDESTKRNESIAYTTIDIADLSVANDERKENARTK